MSLFSFFRIEVYPSGTACRTRGVHFIVLEGYASIKQKEKSQKFPFETIW